MVSGEYLKNKKHSGSSCSAGLKGCIDYLDLLLEGEVASWISLFRGHEDGEAQEKYGDQ